MNWARLSFVLLALMVSAVAASSPPPQPCFFVPRHATLINFSFGGGGGVDLSGAPFITYAENASLTHAVPVSRLNVSITPAQADNFSLSLGNASSYWAGSHVVNAYVVSLCLSGDCRAAWPAGGGEVYNGTFNETEGVYVYNGTNYRIDFNETKLNQTIDSRMNSTTYYPAAFSVDAGVLTGGNLASLFYHDGDTLNVSEAAGANPLIVGVNFTGVTSFDWLLISERYDGGSGHEIYIQIWDFVGGTWETHYIISDQATLVMLPPLYVSDAGNHINATNVSMRFVHLQNGNPAHDIHVDFVQLLDGFSTTTTITHDSLSLRDFDVNHLQYLNRNATRTLLRDWNVGYLAIHNISNLNSTNGLFLFLNVSQQFNAFNASFINVSIGNVTIDNTTFVNPRGASVYLSGNQTLGFLGWTQIHLNATIYDNRGEHDTTTWNFTAQTPGRYHVCVAVLVAAEAPSTGYLNFSIRQNNEAVAWGFERVGGGSSWAFAMINGHLCKTLSLSVGDNVGLWVLPQNVIIAHAVGSSDVTWLTVERVLS